jgi:hypothetical protein
MNNAFIKIPDQIVQEADILSKETKLSFRDCLDILVKDGLKSSRKTLVLDSTPQLVLINS